MFKIRLSGFDHAEKKLEKASLQHLAELLYDQLKAKVPEIEKEKNRVVFEEKDNKLQMNTDDLTLALRQKIRMALQSSN